jgi:hypothetical protein
VKPRVNLPLVADVMTPLLEGWKKGQVAEIDII